MSKKFEVHEDKCQGSVIETGAEYIDVSTKADLIKTSIYAFFGLYSTVIQITFIQGSTWVYVLAAWV